MDPLTIEEVPRTPAESPVPKAAPASEDVGEFAPTDDAPGPDKGKAKANPQLDELDEVESDLGDGTPKRTAPQMDSLDANYVMTADRAYAVIGETLYVSEQDKGNWLKTRYDGVKQLRYGTDQGVYILTKDNQLRRPRVQDGAAELPPITLPENETVNDFAVSITGLTAVLSPEHKNMIGEVQFPDGETAGPANINWVPGPPNVVDIASMVFKPDGELVLADSTGKIHTRAHSGQWTTETPDPERMGTMAKLLVLRGGTPAALNGEGKLYAMNPDLSPGHDQRWEEATHAMPPRVVQFFNRFNSRMDPDVWNRFVLSIPGGTALNNRTEEDQGFVYKYLVPRAAKPDYADQSLKERLGDWFTAHSSSLRSAQTYSPHRDHKAEYQAEVRLTVGRLQSFVRPAEPVAGPAPGDIGLTKIVKRDGGLEELATAVAGNARNILDQLEQELGSNNPDFTRSRHYKKVHGVKSVPVNSEHNALYLLQQTYKQTKMGKANQDILERVDKLLQKQVFLGVSAEAYRSGDRDGLENPWGVWTDKLLHDADLLTRTAADFPAGERPADYVDGESETHLNRVTFMYKQGFYNTTRVEKFFDEVATFSGAMRQDNHSIQRAMNAQGMLTKETAADSGPGAAARKQRRNHAFLKHLQGMEIGQQVQLSASEYYGLDMEGFSQFLKLVPDKELAKNVAGQMWGFEPLLSIGPRLEHTITFTRTADGFDVGFGRDSTKQGLVGFKSQHGVGGNLNNGKLLGFLYTGVNAKVQVLASHQVKSDFVASLKFDERGTVQKFLGELLDGDIDAYKLARSSKGIANSRKSIQSYGPKLDIEPLLASGALASSSQKPFDERFKLIGAPLVEQLNIKLASERTVEDAVNAEGKISRSESATGWATTLDWTHIHVLEGQFGLTADLAPKYMQDIIKQGFEAQFKLPLYIEVWAKQFYRSVKAKPGGYQQIVDEHDQKLTAVEGSASVSNIPADRAAAKIPDRVNTRYGAAPYNSDFNEMNVPELAQLKGNSALWEQIIRMKSDNLPLSVKRELKPDRLKELQEMPATTETEQNAIGKRVLEMGAVPGNWRITEISTSNKMGYNTSANLGIVAARIFSGASSDFTPSPKVLKISYDKEGQPSFTTSGTLTNDEKFFGDKNMSDLRGLKELLDKPKMLELLQDPVGGDAVKKSYAPFVNDILSKLESQNIFYEDGLGEIESNVLAKFFPPKAEDTKPYDENIVNFIVGNRQVLNQFKEAVRAVSGVPLREPIAQYDTVTTMGLMTETVSKIKSLGGRAPATDAVSAFLKNPTHSNHAGVTGLRMAYLPYINQVLANPGEDSEEPLRKACMSAYFDNDKEALQRIQGDPEALKQFQKSIQRAFQQLDSDKQAIHDCLSKLKDDPVRLHMASELANTLKGKQSKLEPTSEELARMSVVFPRGGNVVTKTAFDVAKSTNLQKMQEVSMDHALVDMIVSDPLRLKLFNEGVAHRLQENRQRDLPPASRTEGAEVLKPAIPSASASGSVASRSTPRSGSLKSASDSVKPVPRTEIFDEMELQVIATASAPAVVSGEAPPRSQSPTTLVKTQSVHSTGRR